MYWAYWNQKLAISSPKLRVAHVLQSLADKPQEWAQEHYGHPNIEFRYADYRDAEGLYDRVYSVGMFEHVGRKSFATYFDKVQLALSLKRVSFCLRSIIRVWKHVANSCKLWIYLAYPYPSPCIPTPSLEIYFSILKFPRSMSSNSLMLFHVGMLGVDPLLFLLNILRYDCLKDDGIFLLHTLGWAKRGEWNHNAFATLAWSMGVQESTRSPIKPPTTPWMKWVRS